MVYIKKTTKTQKKFEETLLKLMKSKKFETITVNDITELADVNRSTFYRHYLDKYDLLEKIEDNIVTIHVIGKAKVGKKNEIETRLRRDFYNEFKSLLTSNEEK